MELLRDNPACIAIDGWQEEVTDGEQRAAIEAWLAEANAGLPPDRADARGRPVHRLSTGFPQAIHNAAHSLLHRAVYSFYRGGRAKRTGRRER